jgi:hypothetical protein
MRDGRRPHLACRGLTCPRPALQDLETPEIKDRRAPRVGLITRRSQVQILAPLQWKTSWTQAGDYLRFPCFTAGGWMGIGCLCLDLRAARRPK